MKKSISLLIRVVSFAGTLALLVQGSAVAGVSIEARMDRAEQRIQQLEQRVQTQKNEIDARDRRIAELEEQQDQNGAQESGSGWFQGVTIGGAVEVEAFHTDSDGFSGDDASDINVATAELGVEAIINDWTTANLVLLWEEEDGGDNNLSVDEATITIANEEASPLYLVVGHTAVPFGRFETHMVSDPFTLDLGETKETVMLVGLQTGGFYASAYGFNGDLDDGGGNEIDNGGADVGFVWEGENGSIDVGIGYINDIGDSDAVSDAVMANLPGGVDYENNIQGHGVHAMFSIGPFSMIGEYVTAADSFDATNEMAFNGEDAEPSAWNLEAGLTFDISGHETTVAVGYQETEEALGFGLPESRISAAISVAVMDNTTFSIEWAHDEDYDSSDSALVEMATVNGTGNDSDTITGQLAVEF
jgi:hypothetical protein